jgi:uncharacterized membrane protein
VRPPRGGVAVDVMGSEPLEPSRSRGQRFADRVTETIGTWPFLAAQSVFIALWVAANVLMWVRRFDPYPFILLNLVFSVWSAYAAPVIMMSQNRQNERDRLRAAADHRTAIESHAEIEQIQRSLDRVLALLEQRQS